jgi:hypothetical protein
MAATGNVCESAQCVNAIYAWSRLLELNTADPGISTQAIRNIQQNAERLLRKVVQATEGS